MLLFYPILQRVPKFLWKTEIRVTPNPDLLTLSLKLLEADCLWGILRSDRILLFESFMTTRLWTETWGGCTWQKKLYRNSIYSNLEEEFEAASRSVVSSEGRRKNRKRRSRGDHWNYLETWGCVGITYYQKKQELKWIFNVGHSKKRGKKQQEEVRYGRNSWIKFKTPPEALLSVVGRLKNIFFVGCGSQSLTTRLSWPFVDYKKFEILWLLKGGLTSCTDCDSKELSFCAKHECRTKEKKCSEVSIQKNWF